MSSEIKLTNPLVSIIALNYNQLEVTVEFVESCNELSYENIELIIVDNNSEIDPTDKILSIYPNARIFRLQKNIGFTGGNNYGMERANGDFIFIVNNDTEVTPDLIEKLLQPFDTDKSIGVVSPKIKYFDNPQMIQYAGYSDINPYTGRNKAIGSRQIDEGQFNISGYTPYAHGAAMLVKKEVIDKVGMFPDDFFIYYEELDWSARITRAGYKIYYQSEAEIYHKESITMGKESSIKAYYHTKNRIYFMRRNFSKFQFIIFSFYLTFLIIPKSVLKYVLNGQYDHLKSFQKAILWNLKN